MHSGACFAGLGLLNFQSELSMFGCVLHIGWSGITSEHFLDPLSCLHVVRDTIRG